MCARHALSVPAYRISASHFLLVEGIKYGPSTYSVHFHCANFQVEAFPEGMIYFMSAPGLRLSIDDCFQHTTLLHRERESSMLEAVVKCRFVCKYLPSRY